MQVGNRVSSKQLEILSKRERTCLEYAAKGKSAKETARDLGITHRTVHFHLENARKKLEVEKTIQAVALLMATGE